MLQRTNIILFTDRHLYRHSISTRVESLLGRSTGRQFNFYGSTDNLKKKFEGQKKLKYHVFIFVLKIRFKLFNANYLILYYISQFFKILYLLFENN